jgi:hypothetical protein
MSTGKELVDILRNDILDDIKVPYLWSSVELLRGLNYAEVQACRRAHLIIDGSTANDSGTAATAGTAGQKPLCQLSLIAGQSVYSLNPKILMVKRCQLSGMSFPLIGPLSLYEADEQFPAWMGTSGTVGTASSGGFPLAFMNEPTNTITFLLAPPEACTAFLMVSRLPLLPFTLETSPEIEEKYHEGLLNWAAHLAYMKNDSDTFNPQKAKYYEDIFTSQFGALPDAKSERLVRSMMMNSRMRPRRFGS